MPPSIVEFQHVSKVYRSGMLRRRKLRALQNVSLSVPRGSIFGVSGTKSGRQDHALESPAIHLPAQPRERSSAWDSQPGPQHAGRRRLSAPMPGVPAILTATTLLRYYGALSLVPGRELHERIPRLLEQVGLADRAREPIPGFSKGMLQRLSLAQALVNDPELLVLDEPNEGMDVAARKLLDDTLRRRQAAGEDGHAGFPQHGRRPTAVRPGGRAAGGPGGIFRRTG